MALAANLSDLAKSTSQDDAEIEVSIVMPCLNEARTVGRCVRAAVQALADLGIKGEVIVADNDSTDHSPALAREQGARVVQVPTRGYGNALRAGIAAARGRYVVMGDSDESCDFAELSAFVERLRGGDDLVIGNRFKGGIRDGAMPWLHRYVGNPFLTGVLNLFFRTPVGDSQCGFRAFRKDACLELALSSTGMEFASEMIVKAALHGQRISEVPVVLHPDGRDRPPHLRSFPDGWRHLRFLLLMCPLWLYLIPSIVITALGLALMLWWTPGLDPLLILLGSLLVPLGCQVSWLWVFAKTHAATTRQLPVERLSTRVVGSISLERGLIVAFILLLAGLGLNGWLFSDWLSKGPASVDAQLTTRAGIWGCTLIILGVQAMYNSFFLCMLRMERNTVKP